MGLFIRLIAKLLLLVPILTACSEPATDRKSAIINPPEPPEFEFEEIANGFFVPVEIPGFWPIPFWWHYEDGDGWHCHSLFGMKRTASFNFPDSAPDTDQEDFKREFCRGLYVLENWLLGHPSLSALLPLPRPWRNLFGRNSGVDFEVEVKDNAESSQALVFSWQGERGKMLFPAEEIRAPLTAQIVHELVHAYVPNGNRMLAEGLAVYLQERLSIIATPPNFNEDLHKVASEEWTWTGTGGGTISKPAPACEVEIGQKAGDADIDATQVGGFGGRERYSAAGSFVQFLIEDRAGSDTDDFANLYARTPLIPNKTVAWSCNLNEGFIPNDSGYEYEGDCRWHNVYSKVLPALVEEWHNHLAVVTPGFGC